MHLDMLLYMVIGRRVKWGWWAANAGLGAMPGG